MGNCRYDLCMGSQTLPLSYMWLWSNPINKHTATTALIITCNYIHTLITSHWKGIQQGLVTGNVPTIPTVISGTVVHGFGWKAPWISCRHKNYSYSFPLSPQLWAQPIYKTQRGLRLSQQQHWRKLEGECELLSLWRGCVAVSAFV